MRSDFEHDNDDQRIVAVGLLTRREVTLIGAQLSRLFPLNDCAAFAELLEAIDQADRERQSQAQAASAEVSSGPAPT
jgi:hypothetical protein